MFEKPILLILDKVYRISGLSSVCFIPVSLFTRENITFCLAIIATIVAIFTGIARHIMKRREFKINLEIKELELLNQRLKNQQLKT